MPAQYKTKALGSSTSLYSRYGVGTDGVQSQTVRFRNQTGRFRNQHGLIPENARSDFGIGTV